MAPIDPLSPELALVDPELAARARASLPDRPWERFLPAGPVGLPAVLGPAVEPPVEERRRFVRRVPIGLLVLLALAGALAYSAFPPWRDAPALEPTPSTIAEGDREQVVVSAPGTEIVTARLRAPCGGWVSFSGVAIADDGTFGARTVAGDGATVVLRGSVGADGALQGTLTIEPATCPTPSRHFTTA